MNNKLEKLHETEKNVLIIMNVFFGFGACLLMFHKWFAGIAMLCLWFIGLVVIIILTKKIVDLKYDVYRKEYFDITVMTVKDLAEMVYQQDDEIIEYNFTPKGDK